MTFTEKAAKAITFRLDALSYIADSLTRRSIAEDRRSLLRHLEVLGSLLAEEAQGQQPTNDVPGNMTTTEPSPSPAEALLRRALQQDTLNPQLRRDIQSLLAQQPKRLDPTPWRLTTGSGTTRYSSQGRDDEGTVLPLAWDPRAQYEQNQSRYPVPKTPQRGVRREYYSDTTFLTLTGLTSSGATFTDEPVGPPNGWSVNTATMNPHQWAAMGRPTHVEIFNGWRA